MAAVNDVPRLVDKKGGRYAAIAPKLELGKFNKWKKRMLCYLAGMEPYYLKWQSPLKVSQTYTLYKTLLNELANDGVNLSKHEINVVFMNSLPEKWLTFSQGLRNAYHTQTLDLVDIYGRFNKGLVVETFDWDEEEVSDEEEVTQVKVLMALADDELTFRKSHARNDEWVDITIRKLNHALQEQLIEEKKFNEKWLTSSKKVSQCIKMVPKTKDWVERLNPGRKLPNFNTGRILVPESQAVNESLESTETLNTPESSKDSKAKSLTPLPPLKNLQGASPSSEVTPLTFQPYSPRERPDLGIMKHTKPETRDSSNNSVSGTVTVSETKQTTPLVPTEVKDTEQE
ncbi:hypothetical protein Tco_0340158 [Tanacetum coccineum]